MDIVVGSLQATALFHWVLLPAFIALPVELYLLMYYSQGVSTHHLGIIAETSPRETLEFLGNKVWFLLFVFFAVVAWWLQIGLIVWRSQGLSWTHRSRWFALILLAIAFSIFKYGQTVGIAAILPPPASVSISIPSASAFASEPAEVEAVHLSASLSHSVASDARSSSTSLATQHLPKLPAWADIPFDLTVFGRTWPFGIVVRGYDFWTERKYLADLSLKSSAFQFGAHQVSNDDTPQIVIVVIGESSRYDRWSLNGYARETNPLLKREANLISLSNVITSVSATRLSVPVLLSRKPAMQSLKDGFSEKSFLTAFREAGFKTYWISNQMSSGQFDTPVSVFAKEADSVQFMNLGGFTNDSTYDHILLEPLNYAIEDPAIKKLIVLHTLGNHWNYSHRHPKEFDKWQPSLFDIERPAYTDLKMKPQLNNSYDNSILYTDWFLTQVIAQLKLSSKLSAMMYVSDHGQTLYDGTCTLAFHGHNTQHEFHIPALVWYSDLYQAAHPAKVARLQRNKNAKLSTENVFHSLLDLADIRYSTERLEWSLFSPEFKQHKRYVDSYGWTNYDNATFKGDCREVVDKGTPVKQEK